MARMVDRKRAGTGTGWLERWWEGWAAKHSQKKKWICGVFEKKINMTLNLTMLRSSNKVSTLYIQTSQIYFYPTGSRPRYCSTDSHCSSGESCGNDQTIHADGNQYSAEEGHFRGCRLLWFPFPFLSTDLGWHTHCLSGDGCLHLHSCQVGHESSSLKWLLWFI